MRNPFALFLVTAIAVLGQEPYRNSASAQQSQPPGAEAELIVLVSHLVALGIDCSFKINTSELQKLVGLKGFKIEDFLICKKHRKHRSDAIDSHGDTGFRRGLQ